MAQIPRLNRAEPSSGLPKNDRLNMQVQDQGQQIMQTTRAVAGLAEGAMDVYQKAENQKIETLGNLAEIEFTSWNEQQLAKLKGIQGDPTDAYKAYDESVAKKREEMLASRPDLNERVKGYYQTKIDRTIATQNVSSIKQRGAQQETFDNNVFENTIKLRKDNIAKNAGDPTMIDMELGDMRTAIAKRGLKNGTATIVEGDTGFNHKFVDETGKEVKVKLSDLAEQRFIKERAEGIATSIQVLTASGKIKEAQEMRETYGKMLDDRSKIKIDTKLTKEGTKAEAMKVAGGLGGMTPDEIETELDGERPEVKNEALKILAGQESKMNQIRTLSQKKNFEFVMKDVLEKQKSERPYASIVELESDPKFKQIEDKISAKQLKALYEAIEAPKTSDPKAERDIQNAFYAGDVVKMTPTEFSELTVGLSKSDKSKWESRYFSLVNDTGGEKRTVYNMAGKMLDDTLVELEYIEKDDRNRFTGDNETMRIKARKEMLSYLDAEAGRNPSPEKLQQYIDKYAASVIKGKAFKPSNPVEKKTPTSQAVKKNERIEPTLKDRQNFRSKYGRFPGPNDDKELQALIKANS